MGVFSDSLTRLVEYTAAAHDCVAHITWTYVPTACQGQRWVADVRTANGIVLAGPWVSDSGIGALKCAIGHYEKREVV